MNAERVVWYVLGGMVGLAVLALLLPWLWLPALVFGILAFVVMLTRRRTRDRAESR